jgi:hypothetical protein
MLDNHHLILTKLLEPNRSFEEFENKNTMVVNHFLYHLKCFKPLFGFELDLIKLLFALF